MRERECDEGRERECEEKRENARKGKRENARKGERENVRKGERVRGLEIVREKKREKYARREIWGSQVSQFREKIRDGRGNPGSRGDV